MNLHFIRYTQFEKQQQTHGKHSRCLCATHSLYGKRAVASVLLCVADGRRNGGEREKKLFVALLRVRCLCKANERRSIGIAVYVCFIRSDGV